MTTELDHTRGDIFEWTFRLGNGWSGSMFTGGVLFTLRTSYPATSIVDDEDDAVVHQASSTGGGAEITFEDDGAEVGVIGRVVILETNDWPRDRLRGDVQCVVTGPPRKVYTPEGGKVDVIVRADITRTP